MEVKNDYDGVEHGAAEARASPQMYVAVGVAMVGAAMFGFDQGNFGNVQAFKSFRKEWCLGRYGDATTCGDDGSLDNDDWNDHFVTWGATLITFGAAAGAILAGPPLQPGWSGSGERWLGVGRFGQHSSNMVKAGKMRMMV
eukprot:g9623.t1